MSKVILTEQIVSNCFACPYRRYHGKAIEATPGIYQTPMRCSKKHPHKAIPDDVDGVPYWCPLPDKV
jgi:hypothetical protein